jgi:hypothetical protein
MAGLQQEDIQDDQHASAEGIDELQEVSPLDVPLTVDEAELLAIPLTVEEDAQQTNDVFTKPGVDTVEQRGISLETAPKPNVPTSNPNITLPSRPSLHREKSAPLPAPQHLPPPAPPAPPNEGTLSTDSISLIQLRRLVNDIPKLEPTPYAFVYTDAASFPEELEEWFSYDVAERAMILKTKESFSKEWMIFNDVPENDDSARDDNKYDWIKAGRSLRKGFIRKLLLGLEDVASDLRLIRLEALVYVLLGCWYESAGLGHSNDSGSVTTDDHEANKQQGVQAKFLENAVQLDLIKDNVNALVECDGLSPIFKLMHFFCQRIWLVAPTYTCLISFRLNCSARRQMLRVQKCLLRNGKLNLEKYGLP